MIQDPATFLGWAFPYIPRSARLVHVAQQLALPVAGASSYVDGQAPLGGTSHLLSRRTLDARGGATSVAVLAAGVGLVDYQRSIPKSVAIAAGGTQNLNALFGLAGAVAVRQLHLEGSASGLVLRTSAPQEIGAMGATAQGGITLDDLAIDDTWEVNNPTAGALTLRGILTLQPENARRHVAVQLLKWALDSSGAVTGSPSDMAYSEGMAPWPDPMEKDAPLVLRPVVALDSFRTLAPLEAYGLKVSHLAGSPLPRSAYVLVHLVFAVWPEGTE